MIDWMFCCDAPGCDARYPAWEPLRGTGEAGKAFGREIAALDGWAYNKTEDRDRCPQHSQQVAS